MQFAANDNARGHLLPCKRWPLVNGCVPAHYAPGYGCALLRLPLAVEIAVFAGVDVLGVGHEDGFGLVAGLEVTALCLVALYQLNPLDVVVVEHRVVYLAHLDAVTAVDFLDYGHVLLRCGVNAVLGQQLHGLAAAYQLTGTGVQYFNDVAAHCAAVNFLTVCHNLVPFFLKPSHAPT